MGRQAFAKKVEETSDYVEYLYDKTYEGDYEGLRGRVRITKDTFQIYVQKSMDGDNNHCESCGVLVAAKIAKMFKEDKVFPERASFQS